VKTLALYRRNFLRVELAFAVIGLAGFVIWAEWFHGTASLEPLLENRRDVIYGTAASIGASLLGFVLATTAIVIGYSQSDRMRLVRTSPHYPTLWKIFVAAIRALSALTIVAIAALLLDRNNAPVNLLVFLLAGSSILAAFRLARCIWILEKVIAVISRPEQDNSEHVQT
jgi:Kef-type K+ transport system membrane component KefB